MLSKIKIAVIILLALGLVACSNTTINEIWSKPNITATDIDKIAVIGMTDRPLTRRILEDEFVEEFRDAGISAEQVYQLGSIEEIPHPDSIDGLLSLAGYDAALVAEPVDVSQRVDYVPGDPYWDHDYIYDPFYDYYYDAYWHYHDPGYYVVSDVVQIETRLYDLRTGEMIWSAVSSTVKSDEMDDPLEDYAETIADQLIDNRILAAR